MTLPETVNKCQGCGIAELPDNTLYCDDCMRVLARQQTINKKLIEIEIERNKELNPASS